MQLQPAQQITPDLCRFGSACEPLRPVVGSAREAAPAGCAALCTQGWAGGVASDRLTKRGVGGTGGNATRPKPSTSPSARTLQVYARLGDWEARWAAGQVPGWEHVASTGSEGESGIDVEAFDSAEELESLGAASGSHPGCLI